MNNYIKGGLLFLILFITTETLAASGQIGATATVVAPLGLCESTPETPTGDTGIPLINIYNPSNVGIILMQDSCFITLIYSEN
jgi:hypothetical protein